MSDTSNGGRKRASTREASWQVIVVFAIYSLLLWQEVTIPQDALVLFLGAIGVNLGIFTLGNVKEHQAKSTPPTPPTP